MVASTEQDDLGKLLRQPTISVKEAGTILKVSRNTVYDAIKAGQIAAMEVGKRKLVLTAPLRKQFGL